MGDDLVDQSLRVQLLDHPLDRRGLVLDDGLRHLGKVRVVLIQLLFLVHGQKELQRGCLRVAHRLEQLHPRVEQVLVVLDQPTERKLVDPHDHPQAVHIGANLVLQKQCLVRSVRPLHQLGRRVKQLLHEDVLLLPAVHAGLPSLGRLHAHQYHLDHLGSPLDDVVGLAVYLLVVVVHAVLLVVVVVIFDRLLHREDIQHLLGVVLAEEILQVRLVPFAKLLNELQHASHHVDIVLGVHHPLEAALEETELVAHGLLQMHFGVVVRLVRLLQVRVGVAQDATAQIEALEPHGRLGVVQ
mmetsp:Transcript_13798/g.41047  ORF Transcript_13798/g.41047 Transcript_13798/m.41047 type:complete len:298 (-) Transcript_13798:1476-2369(-)